MNSVTEATSQHEWKQKLTTLIGAANTKTYYEAWVAGYDLINEPAWNILGRTELRMVYIYSEFNRIHEKVIVN